MGSSSLPGRIGTALGVFCLVVALAGCQELIVGQQAAPDEIDYADDLYAVTAVGASHVWAAGYFGAVYHSSDGGESWRRQESLTERSIYDISFADEKHGWAVGRRGFVIGTKDGGETWVRQKTPRFPPRHLFAVDAIDENTAWIVGDWGTRYRTRDGGETWEDLSFLVDEEHPVFQYLSEEEIEAYARGEKVYDDVYLNDLQFLDQQRGWIAGEYGMIFYTTDGGETWEKATISGQIAFEAVPFGTGVGDVEREQWDYLFEVGERLNASTYLRVRVEGFLTPAELARTGNTSLSDDRALSVMDFLEGEGVSQDRIRQVNPTPFDQESVDMEVFTASKLGPAEAVINVIETPFLFDIKFSDAENGLVAGLGGVILQSADGGRTWDYRDSGSEQGLYAIDRGARMMWVVGERGLHRRSPDGGLTWERLAREDSFQERFEFYGFMRDLLFATPERGWIVGHAGFVARSSDGGVSWEKLDLIERGRHRATAAGE